MTTGVIEVRVTGAVAAVDRAFSRQVEPLVTVPGHEFVGVGGQVVGKPRAVVLGRVAEKTFEFPAKLAAAVGAGLTAAGFATKLRGPILPYAHPDPAVLAALPGPAAAMFTHPVASYGGLIRSGRGINADDVVPTLLRALADRRVVVAVKNRDHERDWLDRLGKIGLPQRVCDAWALQHRGWGREPMAHVASLQKLSMCRAEDFDTCVVTDTGLLRGTIGWDPTDRLPDYPLLRDPAVLAYGFVPPGVVYSASEWLRLHALFGWVLPVPGLDPARVLVTTTVPPRPGLFVPDPDDDPVGYRRALYGDYRRNRLVAREAEALAGGGGTAKAGIDPAGDQEQSPRRVAVLAGDPAHVRELAKVLPGWAIRTGGAEPGEPDGDKTSNFIMTEVWAAARKKLLLDSLVDARGWGPLNLPGFPPPAAAPGDTVLLVDVADRLPYGAAARAKKRLRAYRDRGWNIVTGERGVAVRTRDPR